MKYRLLLPVVLLLLNSCTEKGPVVTPPTSELFMEADTLFVSDEDAEIIIGRIRDISLGPNETVYILDSSDKLVKVFDHRGAFVSEMLSGQGRGPGETMNPGSIWVDDAGNLYVTPGFRNS